MNEKKWEPLRQNRIDKINSLFLETYPANEYGDLAEKISEFWIELLRTSWNRKPEELKKLDLAYDPSDPLSRVRQKTTVIAYADSISRDGEKSLETLDKFFKQWFPAIGGLHILPACTVVEDRFNDGYFSQVERDNIHGAFGSNELFADIMHRYFSMNDLVMGHVDIENPVFQRYLEGDDVAGEKFYTFTMEEYESLKAAGSFNKVFRPRPFPLFTIFRRLPKELPYRSLTHNGRVDVMMKLVQKMRGVSAGPQLINILWLFSKIRNDQMLLDEDFKLILEFIDWLQAGGIDSQTIFTRSKTQEVQHFPYIFVPEIKTEEDLLIRCDFSKQQAEALASIFRETNRRIFGEEIRALTTFSHVQADVNTTTFEGLKALAQDLVWYLTMDLNMLRLDAVNYAFKKWGTSCFGLPELDRLMQIIYLSMECISPRIIPNLEVNDSLTTVLRQMTSDEAAPPMMHDFFLASLLPAVFHAKNPGIIGRIFSKISEYSVPRDRIRFSLSESHDGKSVRGSMDLLTFEERMVLADAVVANRGFIKYKSVPKRFCPAAELRQLCIELSMDYEYAAGRLFDDAAEGEPLRLKNEISAAADVMKLIPEFEGKFKEVALFFFTRIIDGRDPYELCISTRDSLPKLDDPNLEIARFLAFETLAFAITGRNVKTIYFNDLLALPNDYSRVESTGELRNIKRTKVNLDELLPRLQDEHSFENRIAAGINNLIALADADPALHFRGNEAEQVLVPGGLPVAVIKNSCGDSSSLTLVNLSDEPVTLTVDPGELRYDNFGLRTVQPESGTAELRLGPFGRLWLTKIPVDIPGGKLVRA